MYSSFRERWFLHFCFLISKKRWQVEDKKLQKYKSLHCKCNAIGMCLSFHITVSRKSFPVLPVFGWLGWRFNFVEVLVDYCCLGAAVMESSARAGGERGAHTLIRTAALQRFPWGEQWNGGQRGHAGRQVRTQRPPSPWHTDWCTSPPYYLIGSLQGGRQSTFHGRIKRLSSRILIGFTGPGTKRSGTRWIKWVFSPAGFAKKKKKSGLEGQVLEKQIKNIYLTYVWFFSFTILKLYYWAHRGIFSSAVLFQRITFWKLSPRRSKHPMSLLFPSI